MDSQKYHMHNRPDREIKNKSEIEEILKKGKFCVIAMCKDNKPYVVTLSYGYDPVKNALYFHCAKQGLKLDIMGQNSEVCATIIEDGGYVITECAHNYKTVVFWGTLQIVPDIEEKKQGMRVLLNHLEGDAEIVEAKFLKSVGQFSHMEILRLDIGEIHAKAGR
jgi:nitroimidazol reductase NimA-like FMN-containing flavoprotein (pyridoxamine 5'-phosphate oxidase superfamily)